MGSWPNECGLQKLQETFRIRSHSKASSFVCAFFKTFALTLYFLQSFVSRISIEYLKDKLVKLFSYRL